MKTIESTRGRFAFLAVLIYTVLLVLCLVVPGIAFADDPPTPPPAPPTRTPTPTPSDTPIPTDTPTPTNTPVPTDTSTPTSTPTPSDTPVPTATPEPTHTPIAVGTTGPLPTSNTNPDCQSVVTGRVFALSGVPAAGATVLIQGADWSDAMLTDDVGKYSFGQLCPGRASLQAFLTDGGVSQLAELDLNGRDNAHVELSVALAGATATGASTPQQATTPEPDMPATGNAGWLLLGAALLAVFLLLIAGTRRALTIRERTEEHD